MSDCKIYPADTVDIYGNVWPTLGENIRNGILGKLKAAKIKIDGKNITSNDLEISSIENYSFRISKKGIIALVDKVYKGVFYLNISYSQTSSFVVSSSPIADIKADILVLYNG